MAKPNKSGWILKIQRNYEYWCPKCEDWVWGDGSSILPYRCGCGKYDYDFNEDKYILTKPNNDNKNATESAGD